ncbi:DEAD (Asp-Glu-Ala-Asp) box polypeptide 20 [Apophysomyces ossiformis]|uniref:RNA helicase n=1 Tax=Apophysomyces ossiformis TaxID=679940 RepID=A0A8H7BWP1_9FUNG|nr:DEAD (Asp-Glu-Ala-Asp) box polypeptide 20 [Apophysomyces ossiformis]
MTAKQRSADVQIDEDIDFATLIQNKQLLQGMEQSGYERPSPIQLQAIPLGRLGVDLIAQAKSGTGKTVVFGVISLEGINLSLKVPQVMIVAPTREIAIQIRDVLRALGQYMDGFRCEAFIGGLSVKGDTLKLHHCQVIIGTPGRLMALLDEQKINTKAIKLLVMDEADRLMSDSFLPQIRYIHKKLPNSKQCVAFSATFTDELLDSLRPFMRSPQTVRLTDAVPTLEEVRQYFSKVSVKTESTDVLAPLKIYRAKFEAAAALLSKIPFYQCMIFVNSFPRAMELSKWLTEMGWRSAHISASLDQAKRITVMEQMRDFKLRVLVCSDLIARGVDIDRVNLVVNVDFPPEIETYLHRVGRTGRFGTSGIAVNLIGPNDQPFLDMLHDRGIALQPLPENVSYGAFQKELTKDEQQVLQSHQSKRVSKESKPLKFTKGSSQKRSYPVKTTDPHAHKEQKMRKEATEEKPKPKKQKEDTETAAKSYHAPSQDTTQTAWQSHPHQPYAYPAPSYPPLQPFFPSPFLLPRSNRSSHVQTKHFIPPDLYF